MIHHGVTPLRDTGPVHLVTLRDLAPDGDPTAFALAAARGLAALEPGDRRPDGLTVPLLVSAWMRQAGLDAERALDVLIGLRNRLLGLAVVDRASEPVPLMAGDADRALCSVAVYLAGLIGRVTAAAALGPAELTDRLGI